MLLGKSRLKQFEKAKMFRMSYSANLKFILNIIIRLLVYMIKGIDNSISFMICTNNLTHIRIFKSFVVHENLAFIYACFKIIYANIQFCDMGDYTHFFYKQLRSHSSADSQNIQILKSCLVFCLVFFVLVNKSRS